MKLSQIIESEHALAAGLPLESLEREISGLTADSREVKPGYLFAALPERRLTERSSYQMQLPLEPPPFSSQLMWF